MSDNPTTLAYQAIDNELSHESASTRRRFVKQAGMVIGGAAAITAMPSSAFAAAGDNSLTNILNIGATAEVLATIVNTVGAETTLAAPNNPLPVQSNGSQDDPVTRRNVQAAAQQELEHYNLLVSLGAKPLTKKIWVPDEVFATKEGLLNTLVAGDQIFVNAYLLATTVAARAKDSKTARYAAEFMGVEAVHRALALQSLGKLGNDRVYQAFEFTNINTAVKRLKQAGFGFGAEGSKAGKFYEFDEVSKRTPKVEGVNTFQVK